MRALVYRHTGPVAFVLAGVACSQANPSVDEPVAEELALDSASAAAPPASSESVPPLLLPLLRRGLDSRYSGNTTVAGFGWIRDRAFLGAHRAPARVRQGAAGAR